ncbi:MAG TPA: glycosyltransferase family 4 protein [Longimicrobiales bacterium]
MRIALVSTSCLPVPPRSYGGTELVIYELAEGLVERGHEVTLFATGDSATSAELRALYPEAVWPPDFTTEMNHVSWAMAEVARGDFDLVHAHSASALACTRLMPHVPLVYTIHHVRDAALSRFYEFFPDPWYVAISADQARREVRLPHLSVIHHGLDPSRFRWSETPGDYVFFMGRFARIKGPHTAIAAAARAGVAIKVAGEVHPVDREFAEREVLWRLEEPGVEYVGCVGGEAKIELLRGARALLAPIEWNEPFGLTLIEAMLSGCPVVAFPRGSVPELVEEGVTGYVVEDVAEMADAIRPGGRVDAFDRRRCRERAVERFSRMRMVMEHERLYERVITPAAERPSVEPPPLWIETGGDAEAVGPPAGADGSVTGVEGPVAP